jgi:hypothetical protein
LEVGGVEELDHGWVGEILGVQSVDFRDRRERFSRLRVQLKSQASISPGR